MWWGCMVWYWIVLGSTVWYGLKCYKMRWGGKLWDRMCWDGMKWDGMVFYFINKHTPDVKNLRVYYTYQTYSIFKYFSRYGNWTNLKTRQPCNNMLTVLFKKDCYSTSIIKSNSWLWVYVLKHDFKSCLLIQKNSLWENAFMHSILHSQTRKPHNWFKEWRRWKNNKIRVRGPI